MPSSSRSSHYHRFIPSEEVEAVSTWEFPPVGGALPEPEPPDVEPDATTQANADALRQQAYDEGFEQGRLAGAQEARLALEHDMRRQRDAESARLMQLLQHADRHFDALEQRLADQVLALACDLARQVVRCELSTPHASLQAVTREALHMAVEDGRPATLRLHPDDAAWLTRAQPDWPSHVRVVEDAQLAPGDCIVESTQGMVDGTVAKRWARAVANLGLDAAWQPAGDADV